MNDFDNTIATEGRLIVVAVNEPLELKQVVRENGRRLYVRATLTKEQFQRAMQRNAEVRKKKGIRGRWIARGDTPMSLDRDPGEPTGVPPECQYFYWVEEI